MKNILINKLTNSIFGVLVFLLGFSNVGYGSQTIRGGSPATIDNTPYIVSLEKNGVHVCAGVIIDRNWILTAGHCVYWPIDDFLGEPDMVHAGSADQTNDLQGQRITIDYSILHPQWNGDLRNGYDLALLKLSEPLCFNENVQAIPYSTNSNPISEGNSALFAGWGATWTDNQVQANLRSTTISHISEQEHFDLSICTESNSFNTHTELHFYSNGRAVGGRDSGGPCVYNNKLIGIISGSCLILDGSPRGNISSIAANVGELSGFISQNVTPSVECIECDQKTDLLVSSTVFSQYEQGYGDIVIQDGGKFIVKENHRIFMGNDRRIIVESGGRLEIEEDAEIIACEGPWHGIEVQSGGSFKSEGSLKDVKFGILGQPNSGISLERGEILGTNEANSVGVKIFGPNSFFYLEGVDIEDFDGGIESTNNSGEYFNISYIQQMNTNEFGIRLNNAASIKHCHIYIDNVINHNAIEISDGPASIMQDIYSDSGILLEDSPFSLVKENTIVTYSRAQFYTLEVRNSDGTKISDNWINSVSMAGIGLINSSINCSENNITLWASGPSSWGIGNAGNSSEIKNNIIQAPNSEAGIITAFSGDNSIENNTITTNGFGIACLGDVNDFLAQNIVDASSGIHVGASPDGIYECNVVTASNTGIDIWENSQGQQILANSLAGVKDLDVKSVLGPQEYHANEFIGGSPSTTLSGSNLVFSRFLVNGNYPYHMPTSPNPSTGWFQNDQSIPVFENCSGIPGNGEFWDFENEDWLCQYYRELLFNHGAESPQVTNFLLNLRRVTETEPDIIFEDCYGLPSGLIGTEEMFLAEIEMTILNGVEILDSGMFINNSLDSFNQINNPKDQDIDFIRSISNDVLQQYFVKNSKYLNELDSLLQLLNSTTWGQNVVLQANVDILKEYINYLKTDRTEYDYSTMMQLAQLCVIDYGRLVYLARIIALENTNVDYSVYDDCRGQQSPPVALDTNSDFNGLYPNPSNGIINIRFKDSTSGRVRIRNIQGSIILDQNIHNQRQINFDLGHSLGIHFVEIIKDNGKTQIEKVIITK